jgi:hypothetical protein
MRATKKIAKLEYHIHGGKPADFIQNYTCGSHFVTEQVLEAFRAAKLTGFDTIPVQAIPKDDRYTEFTCYLLVYQGKAGPAQEECHLVEIEFDHATWDGSDFFVCEGSLRSLVTPRVVDVIKKHKFKGLEPVLVSKG